MRHLPRILVAAGLALVLPAAAAAAPSKAVQTKIEAAVTAAMKEFNIPGAALVVKTQGTRWTKTFGYADFDAKRPVAANDYFAIRSITKSFTVTRILQLIADSKGAMKLDDPVDKYLADIPNGRRITLRMLANMTSGLYNYSSDPDFGAALSKDLTRGWTIDQLLRFALYSTKHPAINFQPGAQYQYSNTNTLLLGKVVQTATGKLFATTLTTAILKPSGLDSTAYPAGVDLPSPSTLGYQGFYDNRPAAVAVNASGLGPAGAMASTVGDLASWGEILAGGQLLPAQLQKARFLARRTAGDPGSPLYDRYGLGMGEIAGWWGHTGTGLGYQAAVFTNVDTAETFAIVVNASNEEDVPARVFCRVLHTLHPGQILPTKSVCDREP